MKKLLLLALVLLSSQFVSGQIYNKFSISKSDNVGKVIADMFFLSTNNIICNDQIIFVNQGLDSNFEIKFHTYFDTIHVFYNDRDTTMYNSKGVFILYCYNFDTVIFYNMPIVGSGDSTNRITWNYQSSDSGSYPFLINGIPHLGICTTNSYDTYISDDTSNSNCPDTIKFYYNDISTSSYDSASISDTTWNWSINVNGNQINTTTKVNSIIYSLPLNYGKNEIIISCIGLSPYITSEIIDTFNYFNSCSSTIKCLDSALFSDSVIGFQLNLLNTSLNIDSNVVYYWSFGNGDTIIGNVKSYTYLDTGKYDVCLFLEDAITKCNSIFCDSILIIDTATLINSIKGHNFNSYVNNGVLYLPNNKNNLTIQVSNVLGQFKEYNINSTKLDLWVKGFGIVYIYKDNVLLKTIKFVN